MTDKFTPLGGRMSWENFEDRIRDMGLSTNEQIHIHKVFEKYDRDGSGISREEFHQGLDELARDTDDPLTREEVQKIRRNFL